MKPNVREVGKIFGIKTPPGSYSIVISVVGLLKFHENGCFAQGQPKVWILFLLSSSRYIAANILYVLELS